MFFNLTKKIIDQDKKYIGFLSLKNLSPGKFWRTPTHTDIIEF